MSKKKDETMMNDAKKTEGEKKYAKLPEKVVAGLPAAAILQSNEKVMDLFARGKKRGRLDSGEMMEVLDDLDLDSDQMEKIYDSLEALSIEIGSEEDILPELPDDLEPPIDEIAEIEEAHGNRFGCLADLLEQGKLFVSDVQCAWMCLNCGYLFEGTEAPKLCPVCQHDQGFFIRLEMAPFGASVLKN